VKNTDTLRVSRILQNLRYTLNLALFFRIADVSFLAILNNSIVIEMYEDKFWISRCFYGCQMMR